MTPSLKRIVQGSRAFLELIILIPATATIAAFIIVIGA